jgi:hypothetical protein
VADVFISYSRVDHARVHPIADRLTALGYSIWWDKQLRAGQAFVDEIERQLDASRCVLTAWSSTARDSTWVYAEAARGLDAKKFLQVRLDGAQLPLPFDALQAPDFSTRDPDWGQLESGLKFLVRGTPPPPPAPKRIPQVGAFATPQAAGSTKLLTAVTAAGLVAYAGALSSTTSGQGLTPDQLQWAMSGLIGVAGASALLSAQRLFAIARAGG